MGAYHSVEANQATGWLDSTPLGCCAPGYWADRGEGYRENDRNYKTRSVVSEQPRSHRQFRQQAMSKTSSMYTDRPTTRDSLRHWVGRRNVETKYWDAESFTGSMRKRQWSKRSSKSAKSRPQISNPTEFRHVDGTSNTAEQATPRRRNATFRPLQLSIYQPDSRLSPLPDFTSDSWIFMPDLPRPDRAFGHADQDDESDGSQFLVRRKPVRSQSVDAFVDAMEFVGDSEGMDYPVPRSNLKRTSSLPDTNRLTTVDMGYNELSSRAESPVDTSGPMAVPRTRADGTNGSVFRKFQSRQGSRPSIEQAIDELNNIVVEARAQKNGPLSPSQGHIPAIAPHLKMTHVRSETLSDIGSAFSTPYSTKHMSSESDLPVPDIDLDMEYEAVCAKADEKARHDILVSFPQPPGAAVTSNKSTRSRLAGFLRRNPKGMADSTATPSPTEPLITSSLPRGSPFYKCEDATNMTSSTATPRTVFGPNTSRYTATSFGSTSSDSSTFVTVTESESDATSTRSMTPDTDHTTAGSDSSGSPRSIHVPVRRLGVDTALRDSHARSMTASVVMDNASKYSSSRSNSNRSDQSARRKPVVQSSAAAKYTPATAPSHAVDDSAFIGVAVSPDDEDDDVETVQRSEPPMAYSTFDPLKSHPPVSPIEPDYGYAYGYGYGYDSEEPQQRPSVVGLAF
ncbi:hypothetical protein IWX90DRAFT_300103 [Phyllosticta citrichinensis]|uniref:Uncharacterized protein n=1 Tax=Phyllosticta citrichinensis TaxID=1130410 RepID=A0ABR1XKP6_9PEZI